MSSPSSDDNHATTIDFLYGGDVLEELEVIEIDGIQTPNKTHNLSTTPTLAPTGEAKAQATEEEDEDEEKEKENEKEKEEDEKKEDTPSLPLKTGTFSNNGETSLGDDWKEYNWMAPNYRTAKESGRLSVYGGTDLSLCTSVDKLSSMGIGIQLYFKLLQHLAITMFVLTLCSGPITATFFSGNRFRLRPYFVDPMYFVYTTLANIGNNRTTAQACVADTADLTGECEASLRAETVTLGGYFENYSLVNFVKWAGVFDASYMIVYLFLVLWFRRSIRIMESMEDKKRTTITDYTIMVKGFPRNTTKKDIVDFFSKRFNPNEERGRVYDAPDERIVDEEMHGNIQDAQAMQVETSNTLKKQRRLSVNQAIAQGLFVEDLEEEERIKQEKTPEFYKKWKVQQEDHRKKAKAVARMKKLDSVDNSRQFYPVANTANTSRVDLYQGSWVAEVIMAYEDGPSIRRYVTKQTLVRAIRRNKALVQMYSKGSEFENLDPEGDLKQKCSEKVLQLEEKLGRLANTKSESMIGESEYPHDYTATHLDGKERRAVCAFVVFNHETSYLRAVEAYGTSWSGLLRRCQAHRLRFPVPAVDTSTATADSSGKKDEPTHFVPIQVERAPDPSDLYWENLDTTPQERRIRVCITALITIGVLAVSFGVSIIVYGSIGEISSQLGNTGDTCNSIKADVVRHAQRNALYRNWSQTTTFSSAANATSFPFTYRELVDEVQMARPTGDCPTSWSRLGYVYKKTGLAVLKRDDDDALALSTCATSMCMVQNASTNCPCVPLEIAELDKVEEHFCPPLACTKSSKLIMTDGILQRDGTVKDPLLPSTDTCSSYGPEDVRTCYCVETMNAVFETFGATVGMAEFLASDGDLCFGTAVLHYLARQLSFAAVFLVVAINIILQKLVAFLAKWERHPTKTDFLSAQMMKTFVVLFINTGFVILIVNSTYGKISLSGSNEAAAGGNATDGNTDDGGGSSDVGFSSFSTLWYSQVGVSITLTMCLDVFTPHLPKLFQAFVRQPLKKHCITNRRKCKRMRNSSATQEDVNRVYDGINFILPVRLATVMNTFAMTITYSGGLPALIPLACISFTLSFNIDRMMLLKYYKRPPEYNTTLVLNYFGIVPVVVLLHLGFSAWMYSDPTVVYSERLDESSFKSTFSYYTVMLEFLKSGLLNIDSFFFNGSGETFIDVLEDRLERVAAIPQIIAFSFIVLLYAAKFILVTVGSQAAVNVRVCLGQLGWCKRLCENSACRLCCESGDAGFEENPPFTEHYVKPCRDTTGRLIRSKELAEKSYITQLEKTKGFAIEMDEKRKITYRTKMWGKWREWW